MWKCKVEGCGREAKTREMCGKHYTAWWYAQPGNAERQAESVRARKYGLTPERFQELWEAQGGCAVCGRPMLRSGRSNDAVAVDHDHQTGAVRGLLHIGCNTALGALNEDPAAAQGLLDYIRVVCEPMRG